MTTVSLKERRQTIKNQFNETKEVIGFNALFIILLLLLLALFVFFADKKHAIFLHTIIWYIIFSVIYIYGKIKGLFTKKKANGFFKSITAIDIYVHFLGLFSITLMMVVITKIELELLNLIYIGLFMIILSIIWESFEFVLEKLGNHYYKRRGRKKVVDPNISEKKSNIAQDLIVDIIGIIGALFYIFILF